MVDAGNALFKDFQTNDANSRARAEFILRTMGSLGTVAMSVGSKDLSAGVEFLKSTAAAAGVKVLSVNLKKQGKRPFPASTVATVAGVRVALIGISPAGASDVDAPSPVASAVAEAKKLRKGSDVVIALAAVPYPDALEISKMAGDSIDLILQSHESRSSGAAQRQDHNFVIPTGDRGRELGQLALDACGKGQWVDLAEVERSKQAEIRLDQQIQEVKRRMEAASESSLRQALKRTLDEFEARKIAVKKDVPRAVGKRTLSLSFTTLGAEIPDDPPLRAQVAAFERTDGGQ